MTVMENSEKQESSTNLAITKASLQIFAKANPNVKTCIIKSDNAGYVPMYVKIELGPRILFCKAFGDYFQHLPAAPLSLASLAAHHRRLAASLVSVTPYVPFVASDVRTEGSI